MTDQTIEYFHDVRYFRFSVPRTGILPSAKIYIHDTTITDNINGTYSKRSDYERKIKT